jgi:hypothetical protein
MCSRQKPLELTEPEIVGHRQDENDSVALGLLSKQEGCSITAGYGHAASPIIITWRYCRKSDPRVDILQENEQQLALQKISYQRGIESDMRVSRYDMGFFNVRLSSSQVKRLRMVTTDPGVNL